MSPRDESTTLGWKEYLGNEMVRAVLIRTPERWHAPSWAHYITAEGNDREVSIYFSTCVVRVAGFGLETLLRKVVTQRIAELFVPTRADRLRLSDKMPGISSLAVEAVGGKGRM
ncbi:MAG TPA: hypothetical protein VH639_28820 [Bryobacteraceae bacterium]|jgi:hypothetical protein